jgi:hypothetical protein
MHFFEKKWSVRETPRKQARRTPDRSIDKPMRRSPEASLESQQKFELFAHSCRNVNHVFCRGLELHGLPLV